MSMMPSTYSDVVFQMVSMFCFIPATCRIFRYSISKFTDDGADMANTEGGQVVTIFGTNFGPVGGADVIAFYGMDDDVLADKFVATDCIVIVAHTAIRCVTVEGTIISLCFVVEI